MRRMLLACLIVIACVASALAHGELGITEKLGQSVPLTLTFHDETGAVVPLRDYLDKPTIVAPVYLSCANECPESLSGLASVISNMHLLKPGRDYQVATLSFDEKDTPELAREKKKNYIAAIEGPFPEEAWKFLVGDERNIDAFMDAIGFGYRRTDEGFDHPLGLVVLAPQGKIVRYLYGTQHAPMDVAMAINEASQGRVGSAANRILNYCFSYDPAKKGYVFNVLKVVGTVVVAALALFALFLFGMSRKKRTPSGGV